MKIVKANDGMLLFYCEGCKCHHGVNESWQFNNDFNKPTFSPSILVRGTQRLTDEEADLVLSGQHFEPKPLACHSFVTDGKIQYLSDCTHELAGKTIELEEIEE